MAVCKHCNSSIGQNVIRCPFCGAWNPVGRSRGAIWFWVFLAAALALGLLSGINALLNGPVDIDTPPSQPDSNDR